MSISSFSQTPSFSQGSAPQSSSPQASSPQASSLQHERKIDLHPSWLHVLASVFKTDQMRQLRSFLVEEKRKHTVYPPNRYIFNALNTTPLSEVKVVILGQDPYHGKGQAHGLSFSVNQGIMPPPSLQNIFRELQNDLRAPLPPHGNLTHWAQQGVLLLNTVLTVRASKAGSHRNRGWEFFTDHVIQAVSQQPRPVVFILWGRQAQAKKQLIAAQHLVIESPHPSPYSADRGFFGSRPFSRCNQFLQHHGITPIQWSI